jgi:hypothetical protein
MKTSILVILLSAFATLNGYASDRIYQCSLDFYGQMVEVSLKVDQSVPNDPAHYAGAVVSMMGMEVRDWKTKVSRTWIPEWTPVAVIGAYNAEGTSHRYYKYKTTEETESEAGIKISMLGPLFNVNGKHYPPTKEMGVNVNVKDTKTHYSVDLDFTCKI